MFKSSSYIYIFTTHITLFTNNFNDRVILSLNCDGKCLRCVTTECECFDASLISSLQRNRAFQWRKYCNIWSTEETNNTMSVKCHARVFFSA